MPISECVNGCVTNDRLGLVRLADLTVTKVRQRMAREQLGHRGRKGDLARAHRMLLLRAGDRLPARTLRRLDHVFARDDPTGGAGNNGPVSTATASSFLNAAGTMGG